MAARILTTSSNSILYSILLLTITVSLQQMYKETLASTQLYTIVGGFISSLIFFLALTLIGNVQESVLGSRTGWGAVVLALFIACVAAGGVHRVSVTTCIPFSMLMLYEVNKVSGTMHQQAEVKKRA